MTTTGSHTPRTLAANQARQSKTEEMLRRVETILRQMLRDHVPITYPAVAHRSGVSRSFLYENGAAKQQIADARSRTTSRRQQRVTEHAAEVEASWRERAFNAEDALKVAYAEIDGQREQIGRLLGQIRDLERPYDDETVQHYATENTTLKHRVRQLAQDGHALEDKLKAARSNNASSTNASPHWRRSSRRPKVSHDPLSAGWAGRLPCSVPDGLRSWNAPSGPSMISQVQANQAAEVAEPARRVECW